MFIKVAPILSLLFNGDCSHAKSHFTMLGKVGLGSDCTTIMEVEPQRCRRTDGKKWQCGRDTLPNQKYCQTHMHRGAKRHGTNNLHSRNFGAHASCTATRNLDRSINLNTVPASSQHSASNDSSSTTSDATTISDEHISFCLRKLSPQWLLIYGVCSWELG